VSFVFFKKKKEKYNAVEKRAAEGGFLLVIMGW
jgi:hypothetical protein